jgi:hypothetical protein
MNEEYVKQGDWVKCTIDEITYDCYFEYSSSRHLSKPWVTVTVRKYITKKWWFFKWKIEEFECDDSPNLRMEQYRLVNDNFYFKSEYIKDWVNGALSRRENEIYQKKSQQEEEKKLKVIKEIDFS